MTGPSSEPSERNSRTARTLRFKSRDTSRRRSTAARDPLGGIDVRETDLIIVAQLADGDPTIDRLAALNFRGTTVVDAAGAYASLTGRIPVHQVDSRWFIATGDFSTIATSPFHYLQRFFDLFAATALLILTTPVLILSGLASCSRRPAGSLPPEVAWAGSASHSNSSSSAP